MKKILLKPEIRAIENLLHAEIATNNLISCDYDTSRKHGTGFTPDYCQSGKILLHNSG